MSLTPLSEAFERLGETFKPLPSETIAISAALGRVVSEDLFSRVHQPPVPVSAMDGYAVHHQDVLETDQKLHVIGKSQAGGPFDGSVKRGEAVRIFTGAAVPGAMDCIMVQEDAVVTGDFVSFREVGYAGKYVRPQGFDFSLDQKLIKKGTRITARHIGLMASMNIPWIRVYRKPVVGILATGDELVMPGVAKTDAQIYSSNAMMIQAMVEALGAVAQNVGIAGDTVQSLKEHLHGIEKFDLFITIGGVSVGDYDLVGQVLGEEGMDLSFYKIAIKPGKPFMHGKIKGTAVMGLPGNPVSSYVTAHIFLRAALRKMMGLGFERDGFESAVLAQDLKPNGKRMDFMRCRLERTPEQTWRATPFMGQDSSLISILSDADGFIVRDIDDPARTAGETVKILQIRDGAISV